MSGSADRRVHPTVDDPTVALVSESVGGPVGPARRAAPVVDAGPRRPARSTARLRRAGDGAEGRLLPGGLELGHDPLPDMCYSDLPYLYTGRGLVELAWPFTDDPQVRARFEVMEYPVGISYWAYGAAWVTHWLSGSPDLGPRYDQDPGALFGQPDIQREIKLFVVVNAVGFAALALLSAWFLAGVHRDRPWDAAAFALSPALALAGLVNWDLIAVAARRRRAVGVVARQPDPDRGDDRARHHRQALPAVPARRDPRHLRTPPRSWPSSSPWSARRSIVWLLANAPAYLTGPDAVEAVLDLQLRPRRRPRLGLAADRPGRRRRLRGRHDQRLVARGCSWRGASASRRSASRRRPPRGWPSSAS